VATGFLAAITFASPSPADEGAVGAALMDRAQQHGLLIRAIGDTIGFAPPLIATAAEIEEMASRFDTAYADVLAAGIPV
jgi:4-aminobutyrate--pyruvate transaminase